MLSLRYRITFIFCLAALILTASTVSAQFFNIYGRVLDASGQPVFGADLDFIVDSTGAKIPMPGKYDETDINGYYALFVAPNTYNISYAPPVNSHLLGTWIYNFVIPFPPSPDTIPDIRLDFGTAIHGTVTDSLGNPLSVVNIDVDSLGAGRVFTPNDKIKAIHAGKYWIVSPPGDYRVRFRSPPGSRYMGVQFDTVKIRSTDILIDVMMAQGLILSGKVTDQTTGLGINKIKIDIRDAVTGAKVYTSNNKTDTAGVYSIAVSPGMYQVRFSPIAGSRYIGVLIDSVSVNNDTVIDQSLQKGTLVTVNVTDSAGVPVVNANLDFKLASTGLKVYTPNDKTDVNGTSTVSILPDTYVIHLKPPLGTIFSDTITVPIPFSSDTVLNFVLHEVPRVRFTGQITGTTGSGLANIKIGLRIQPADSKVYLPNNRADINGNFDLSVPIGLYDLLLFPPVDGRLVGQRIPDVLFVNDTIANFTFSEGLIVTGIVLDRDDIPLAVMDFDFISETSGSKVFTPFGKTDSLGVAVMVVPNDVYSVVLYPPAGSLEAPDTSAGIMIQTDTAITFHFGARSGIKPGPSFVLRQNYPNPFNDGTSIKFSLLGQRELKLEIFNALGQLVKSLASGNYPAGTYEIKWDGANSTGKNVASGVYFYRLATPDGSQSRRMLILR